MDTRFVLYSRKKNQCVVVLLVKKGLQSGYCKIPYICPYASLAFKIICCSFFSPNFKHEILFQNKKSPRRVWTWTKTIKFISNIILNIFLDGKLSTIIYLRFNFITLELQRSPFSIWSESGTKQIASFLLRSVCLFFAVILHIISGAPRRSQLGKSIVADCQIKEVAFWIWGYVRRSSPSQKN